MFVLEYKVKPAKAQIVAIEDAIRTAQFIRNKSIRFWMDNRGVGKKELYRNNTLLRKEFSFADELNSHACQSSVERALLSINKFYSNCKKNIKGKKGYPKFKHNSRSVEYKTSGWKLDTTTKKHITFTDKKNIGRLKLIGSRDLYYFQPEQIKRVRILRRSDGYYVQFVIKLDPRDIVRQFAPTQKAIGIDLGLKYFYADSNGQFEENPRFYRKCEQQLNRLNRQKSKKFRKGYKQSNNYHKARIRYSRKHLDISRKREEYVKKIAHTLVKSNDFVAYENLNVKGMVRGLKLGKSISDAGWSRFKHWLDYFAYKYGKVSKEC